MTDALQTDDDPLQKIHAEILAQAARIRKVPRGSHTTGMLAAEIDGTVLSLMASLVGIVAQTRDGIEVGLVELEDRVEALEGDESQLTGEDADKLAALVETCKHLVTVIRGSGTSQTAEVEAALTAADALAVECGELVEAARMEEDDEDDEEGDDAEEGEATS